MFKNLKLRTKITLLVVFAAFIPMLASGLNVAKNNIDMQDAATEESIKLATTDLDHIAESVYRLCEMQDKTLTKTLNGYMTATNQILEDQGGVSLAYENVPWQATNQFSQSSVTVELPKLLLGNIWFGQIRDPNTSVPLVDRASSLAEGLDVTVFQRMNNSGDMLRVATSIINTDGQRGIGTFLPRTQPDGKTNPVLAQVLRGQAFRGVATSGGRENLAHTIYQPIFDVKNKIVGMIGMGIRQTDVVNLKEAIYKIVIGKTGYLWVLDNTGHYVISENGTRDGEDISQAKDAAGDLFIQQMVAKGLALKAGEFAEHSYPWQNPGDPAPRKKIARIVYFAPWNWVIGAGSYEDEFLSAATRIENFSRHSRTIQIIVALACVIIFGFLGVLVARTIARPIINIADAVNTVARERDLTIEVPVESKDEVGVMAGEFNKMMKLLRESFHLVTKAAQDVERNAGDVAQRASANKERAEHQAQQMQIMKETVQEMRATAAEVAGASEAQREAADVSNNNVSSLMENMRTVTEASGSQVEEAGTATDRVQDMGDTGTKVVENAQNQGTQVEKVSQAVGRMETAVNELTSATNSAMEFASSALQAVEEGTHSVEATVEGMKAISESSEQISEIITVITEIAEQTNLLSLNAAIEAARAGAHGKGFAVVADEVGKLAQRSSEAAKEITQLIKDSTARVAEGTKLSDQSRQALEKIAAGGGTNMQAIQEISRTADNIAEGTREVNTMMEELNNLARGIAEMAGQQGERRSAAQAALAALVEKSNAISELITNANQGMTEIGTQMKGVVERTHQMKEMTGTQAQRSQKLTEITEQSASAAMQTMEGAGTVVGITGELKSLSEALTRQVEQFKVGDNSGSAKS